MLQEFANYLIRQWQDPIEIHPDSSTDELRADPFCPSIPWHWYQHSGRPQWEQWMRGGDATGAMRVLPRTSRETLWWCYSLREAARHYSWTMDAPNFDQLAQLLRLSMEIGDDAIVGLVCLRIFKWGGLAGHRSTRWVEHHAARGTLIARISEMRQSDDLRRTHGSRPMPAIEVVRHGATRRGEAAPSTNAP